MYGVDKCPAVYHTYTPVYDAILSGIRDTASYVLEIGIGNPELMIPIVGHSYKPGASLRMWRDYFPKANVIGCDIRRDVFFNDEERIQCEYADQSSVESLCALKATLRERGAGKIDLVVDDGSHNVGHMVLTFNTLWDIVAPGGFYIIEDIQPSDIKLFEQLAANIQDCKVHYSHVSWDGFVCFKKVPIC